MKPVIIGDATLYLGDCAEIMPLLGKVDAVITDPPYGIGASTSSFQNAKKRGSAATASTDYGDSSWDVAAPSTDQIEAVVQAGDVAILWGGNFFDLPPSPCWLVWDKENGNNGYADCELAWTNMDKAVRRIKWRWAGMLQQNMMKKEDRVHPTQKPIAVMEWSIMQASQAGSILYPYMGSGTTGIAAIRLGRKFIGVERDPKYFDIACSRIEQAVAQGQLFAPEPVKQVQESFL